ncbi:hypothetical protein ACHAW6_004953 [Cyclotella cf. meneghiniana]
MKFQFVQAASFLSLVMFAVSEKPVLRGADGYQPYDNNQGNGYNGGYTPYGNQNNQNNQNQERNHNQNGENRNQGSNPSDCGAGMCQGEDGYGPCVYSCPDAEGGFETNVISFYDRSGDPCRECDSASV